MITFVSFHRTTTVVQLAVCRRHRSAKGGTTKNSNSSVKDLRKLLVYSYGVDISSDKSKILVNSIKPRPPPTHGQMEKKTMEEVDKLKYPQNQIRNINK